MQNESKLNEGTIVKQHVRYIRYSFSVLSWVFVVCVIIQVFFAGLAVFVNPIYWENHSSFIHLLELLPIVMFILSFPGKLSKVMRWQSLGLFGLIIIQYATVHMDSVWVLAALHPVIALALFWISLHLALRSLR